MMARQLEIPESHLKESPLGCAEDPTMSIAGDHLQEVHDHPHGFGTRADSFHAR